MTTQSTVSLDRRRFAALNNLPPGYALTWRLGIKSRRIFILLNVASALPMILAAIVFFGIDRLLVTLSIHPAIEAQFGGQTNVPLSLLCAVLVVLMLSFHELCHGLAFQAFGAHARYGVNFRKAVAYARADDYYLTRDAYIVVALAPLVVITIVTLICMALTGGGLRFIVGLMGMANAGGAIGDLWFTAVCLRYPRHLLVRDFGEGAELFIDSATRT